LIIDSSAIVAVIRKEPGYLELAEQIRDAEAVAAGAPTLVETEIVLTDRFGPSGRTLLQHFVVEEAIDVIAFGREHWREAGRAFRIYGKGRHPARLNLGDCLTYATARIAGEPLLAQGDDFAKTDLELV
jgi:ribonuclease VapC